MIKPSRLLCALLGVFTLLSFIPVSHAQDYTSGLAGHWRLSETTGQTVNPVVGEITGDWSSDDSNDVQSTAGMDGAAFTFDSTNSERVFFDDDDFPLQGLTNLTVSVWVKPDSDARKIWFRARVNNNQNIVQIEHNANSTMSFRTYDSTGSDSSVNMQKNAVPQDRWSLLTMTYDGTTRAYINGVLASTSSTTGLGATRSHSSGSSDMRISDYSGSYPVDGDMDDLKIWNRTLSDADVKALYDSYFSVDPNYSSGLVGHWKMDKKTGTVVPDSSGSNHDGVFFGSPTWSPKGGYIAGALSFGSVGGFDSDNVEGVNLPDDIFDGLSVGTVSAWVYHLGTNDYRQIFVSGNDGWFEFAIHNDKLRIWSSGCVGGNLNVASYVDIPVNTWTHVAYVTDSLGHSLYINGARVSLNYSSGDVTYNTFFDQCTTVAATTYAIGWTQSLTDPEVFDGLIDDVRVYNQALSPYDIQALVAETGPRAGTLRYNDEAESLEYYDSREWIHAGLGSYSPNAVSFDGVDDYLQTGNLSNLDGATKVTGSFWARRNVAENGNLDIILQSDNSRYLIQWETNNRFFTKCKNTEGDDVAAVRATVDSDDGAWHHVMWSWDLETPGSALIYVDDVDVTNNSIFGDIDGGNGINDTCDFASTDVYIARNVLDTLYFNGDIADFWVDFGTYIDLSVEENRRRFISENGMPMMLGANGSLPAGGLPDIFLSGDTVDWHENKGAISGFTENGKIVDAVTEPIKCEGEGPLALIDVEDTPDDARAVWGDGTYVYVADGDTLRAHTFDGVTITPVGTPYDPSGMISEVWGDGDYIYFSTAFAHTLNAATFNGTTFSILDTITPTNVGGIWGDGTYVYVADRTGGLVAYTFDGSDFTEAGRWEDGTDIATVSGYNGYIFAGEDASSGELYALSFDGSDFTLIDTYTHATATCCYPKAVARDDGYIFISYHSASDRVAVVRFNGTSFTEIDTIDAGNSWNSDIFVDDNYTYVAGNSRLSVLEFDGTSLSVFEESTLPEDTYPSVWHDGTNVWVADGSYGVKAASGYEGCSCSVPEGPKGRMIYNSSDKVMQYCNGTDWVGMGDINNGTGLGCINPTGVAGQMIYNGDYDLLQYCNSDDWIGVGKNVGSLLSTGLEGHWRLDETSGSLILDSSGNGNDGTWADTVNDDVAEETLPGKVDRSIVFDAVDDEIVVPNDETLENFEELTLSAWVYPTAIGQGNSSRIISKSNGGSGDDYALRFEQNEQVSLRITTSTGQTNINGTDDLILNSWSHVVGTWDGSVMRVYINGIEQDNVAKFGTIDASGDELAIGMHPDAPALRYFPGRIDDARVYSRALSAEEVVLLYGSTNPVDLSTGLEGHWTMNDLSGAVVVDSSGKGRNGVWTDSDDDDVIGESENAMIAGGLRFDGVDDVATVPAFDLFGSGMTMAAWVKIDDSDADLDPRIISKADGTGVADHDWNMYIDDANGLTARVRTTGVTREVNTGGYFPPDGVWTHVAATYSVETENVVFYVNGAHYRTRSHADGGPIGVGNTARDIGLGNNPAGAGARIFDGVLDDIRLYSRPLGPTEMVELYELGAGSILTGLVGHWPLDDTSGSTIRDFSGDANDGTWSDASGNDVAQESVLAPIGTGLHFDGADDVITVPASTQLENIFVGGGTYAAWIYPETEGEGDYGRIFAKNSSFNYNNQWHMDGNRGEAMAFSVECSSNHWWWRTNTGTVPLNRWSHVAVVYDSSSIANLPTFYVNGSPVGYTTSGTCTGTVEDDASDILYIGNASSGSRDFDGNIDDARIYDRALSAGDIQALYQLGAFVASDNLVGHWTLNDESGSTIVDSSPNGNDGTWSDNDDDDVVGETGPSLLDTGLYFDGVDDYIQLPNLLATTDPEPFTVCAWFNANSLHNGTIWNYAAQAFNNFDRVITLGVKNTGVVFAGKEDQDAESSSTYTIDTWNHVCGIFTGSGDRTVYLNAGSIGTDTTSRGADNLNRMAIGARWGDSSSRFFDGDIDDVRIYDYAFSASDVQQLYDVGLNTIPTSGLVGHWSMDETSGGTISDSTGSNNGTWSDGDDDDVTGETTSGQVDRAIEFDGNDDVIETGAWDITGGDGGFTISSWINPDYFSDDPRIISKTDGGNTTDHDWAFLVEDAGEYLRARITTVNGYEEINTDGDYVVPTDSWTHVTVTYDPANTVEEVRIFANGEVVTVGDHTLGGNVITGSGKDVAIGDNPASAGAVRNFDGELDDVRVYNRGLSVPEVRALYNATR